MPRIHPLHAELAPDNPYRAECIKHRRFTGRTTANCLQVLATVLKSPGLVVHVVDHHGTPRSTFSMLVMLKDMVQALQLRHVHIDFVENTVVFESRNGNEK